MTIEFLFVESSVPKWTKNCHEEYRQKISKFVTTKIEGIKSPSLSRADKAKKIEQEGTLILKKLKPEDHLCVLDEKGKNLDSQEFSKWLSGVSPKGKGRLVFLIGGAFGVSEKVKSRANSKIRLSEMVLSHVVAQTVLLEQVYRGLTIINDIPYHNQ